MIRPLTAKQLPQVIDLIWDCYQATEAEHATAEENQRFRAYLQVDLLKHQLKAGSMRFFGAFDGKTLVAVACLRRNHLSLLFVSRETQRCGQGKRLMRYLIQLLVDEGFSEMTVNASPRAVGFYQQQGFVFVENQQSEGNTLPMMLFLTVNNTINQ